MNNVVLLTIDVLRKDALGCYGNGDGLTPFIDSIQDKCIRFNEAQACGPYTQASFPGILTSSYYMEYGLPKRLSSKRTLISQLLKKAGIATAAFHSNANLCEFLGWNRGWDVFYDSMEMEVTPKMPYAKGDVINRKSKEWLTEYVSDANEKPFFLWVHYMDVHEPYVPERKYVEMVAPDINLDENAMFRLFEEVLHPRNVSNEENVRILKKLYDAHVRETDDYVRGFFHTLEELDLLNSTTIILTSDHGDEFSEHKGLSHDDKMYSELINVPLLVYEPDRERGEECGHLVSNVDISPTILHLFGLEPAEAFHGQSLLPLDTYTEKGCFGEALHQIRRKGPDISKDVYYYREGDFKIIYRGNLDQWELYDLRTDPMESNNVIDSATEADGMKNTLLPRVRRWEKKK